jgi:hypothetical protein
LQLTCRLIVRWSRPFGYTCAIAFVVALPRSRRALQTLWRTGPLCVEGIGTPRAGCGVSLRAEDYGLGAGPTIYERSADA